MTPFLQENEHLGAALENLIRFYSHEGASLLDQWKNMGTAKSHLLFFGMGTSKFTPLLIKWRLLELGLVSDTIDAGEWHYYGPSNEPAHVLSVLTSQSGESIEIRNLIEQERIGTPFVAITNDIKSILGQTASLALPLCAGEEKSITTKTFTNNLALLYLMAAALTPGESVGQTLEDLKNVAELLAKTEYTELKRAAEVLLPADSLVFVARGPAVVSAKQCALTYMEGARTISSAFTGGAFNHGPFESVDESFRLVVFRPDGPSAPLLTRCAEKAVRQNAGVVIFTDQQGRGPQSAAAVTIPKSTGRRSEMLFPILTAVKQNYLLHLVAEGRGIEAGVFRYGSKVTSRE